MARRRIYLTTAGAILAAILAAFGMTDEARAILTLLIGG